MSGSASAQLRRATAVVHIGVRGGLSIHQLAAIAPFTEHTARGNNEAVFMVGATTHPTYDAMDAPP